MRDWIECTNEVVARISKRKPYLELEVQGINIQYLNGLLELLRL